MKRLSTTSGQRRPRRRRRLTNETLETRALLAAEPLITELLASNEDGLLDGHGVSSDWIELHNAGDEAINLNGWFLTDDPAVLNKWQFPDFELLPEAFELVFASGDDAPDPAGNLHTNFQLNSNGEYVALVMPDGVTVVSELDYPDTPTDVGFGLDQFAELETFFSPTSPAQFVVPDAALAQVVGDTWREVGFDDSSWQPVSSAVGYEVAMVTRSNVALNRPASGSTAGFGFTAAGANDGNPVGNSMSHTTTGDLEPWWEVDLTDTFAVDQVIVRTRDNCCTPDSPERDYNILIELFDDARDVVYTSDVFNAWDGTGASASDVGNGFAFDLDLLTANGGTVDAHYVRVSKTVFGGAGHSEWLHLAEVEVYAEDRGEPINQALGKPTSGEVAFGRPTNLAIDENPQTFTHSNNVGPVFWELDLEAPTDLGYVELLNRGDGCCPERLNGAVFSVLDETRTPIFTSEAIQSAATGQVLTFNDAGRGFPAARYIRVDQVDQYLSLAEVRAYSADETFAFVNTDIQADMHNVNASAWLRHSFDVDEPATVDRLEWSVNFDDGFAAFLNGTEVARVNAPEGMLAFDATASATHSAGIGQTFTLDPSLLLDGNNVLAVHGLNVSAGDDDFLFSSELRGRRAPDGDIGYLIDPTPGERNGQAFAGFVADTTFDLDRGFYTEAIEVAVTTRTAGATIIYTTDGSLPSWDNGTQVPSASENEVPVAVVPISTTTTLRAAAFKVDYAPSDTDTQTYLFIDDILVQPNDPAGFPAVWDGLGQDPIPADYAMDPRIVDDPSYADDLRAGLQSIPTVSMVMSPEHLFGSDEGIYINSGQRGIDWEHPASFEIIEPDGTHFQTDTGMRIHGFSWRFHSNTPKHSFRLEFRDEYGPRKLEYPLFRDAPVDRFDSIVLRAQGGRAWAGRQNPNQAQYLRDTFARDTARDMGKIDGHAAFFHLYLNGLYWGMYHAVERPDAQMGEEYFGGNEEDYDALNRRTTTNEAIDGDLVRYNEMLALAETGLASDAAYAEMQRYVDIDNLIDFFLIHQYTTNRDGPETFQSNNQRAIGSRVGDAQFRFFVWDMEYSIWDVNDNINIDVDVPGSISQVFTELRANAEFRQRYADRAHQHLFNDGALTPDAVIARYDGRANEIANPIVAESARWGDAIRAQPYTRDAEWETERQRLMTEYFPFRTQILVDQLRDAGLYNQVDAPSFSQHGGQVAQGFELTISAPTGTVYYTTDGSDPRLPGGELSTTAIEYTGAFQLADSGSIRARARDGDEWSAINSAEFFVHVPASADNLRISEVNYHPLDPTAAELAMNPQWTDNAFEFVEVHNISNDTIDLSGVHFTSGLTFTFAGNPHSLPPGERVVVVRDLAAFRARYGETPQVAGEFQAGALSNSGEAIEISDRTGLLIHRIRYNDGGRSDGLGSSLDVAELNGTTTFETSVDYLGSPAASPNQVRSDVVINEVLTNGQQGQLDAIELHNTTDQPIDVSNWWLSDVAGDYQRFSLPGNTIVGGGEYLVVDADDFHILPDPALSLDEARGDDLWLLAGDATGRLIRFVDEVTLEPQAGNESWGRWPTHLDGLYPMIQSTLGAANAGPRVGPVVISEVMYHPVSGNPDVAEADLEFIEIYNPTAQPVSLTNWRVTGGIEWEFADDVTLEPGQTSVVVGFDPVAEPATLDAFRQFYELPINFMPSGPFSLRLGNNADELTLRRPGEPAVNDPTLLPRILEDRVSYLDSAPWPERADGDGSSLTRDLPSDWGLDAASWFAASPSPGSVDLGPLTVVAVIVNDGKVDPPNLNEIPQPTSWRQQRSRIDNLTVLFNKPILASGDAVELMNLGVNAPADDDAVVDLGSRLTFSANEIRLDFSEQSLADGVLEIRIGAGVTDRQGGMLDGNGDGTPGDDYSLTGNQANGLYQLTGDNNGDLGVTIFDFPTLSYWFGQRTAEIGGTAPEYADNNGDGGVSIFDFPAFAENFGTTIVFPPVAKGSLISTISPKTSPSVLAFAPTMGVFVDAAFGKTELAIKRGIYHEIFPTDNSLIRTPIPYSTGELRSPSDTFVSRDATWEELLNILALDREDSDVDR